MEKSDFLVTIWKSYEYFRLFFGAYAKFKINTPYAKIRRLKIVNLDPEPNSPAKGQKAKICCLIIVNLHPEPNSPSTGQKSTSKPEIDSQIQNWPSEDKIRIPKAQNQLADAKSKRLAKICNIFGKNLQYFSIIYIAE